MLRRSFLDHFAEEFAPFGPAERTRAVLTAELAFQFEAFEFLWTSTNGQVPEMRTILIDHLTMCLGRLRSATRLLTAGPASNRGQSRADGRGMVLTKGDGCSQVHPRGPDRRAAGLRVPRPRPGVVDPRSSG